MAARIDEIKLQRQQAGRSSVRPIQSLPNLVRLLWPDHASASLVNNPSGPIQARLDALAAGASGRISLKAERLGG